MAPSPRAARAAPSWGSRLALAAALHAATVAALVLNRTLVDLIFLSTYPRRWLPHLFIGQTAACFALSLSVAPLLKRGSRSANAGVLLAAAASVIAAGLAQGLNIPGYAFGLCLWLSAVAAVMGVMSWTISGDAFDPRELKRSVRWLTSAGSTAGLIAGLVIPLVRSRWLLYAMAGTTAFAAAAAALLKPLPAPPPRRGTAPGGSPWRHGLFRTLAGTMMLVLIVDTIADYALKSEVGAACSREGIAAFMGRFYGISSLATLLLQLFGTNTAMRLFGVVGLAAALPLFCVGSTAVMAWLPGLWTAAAFRMGETVFRYSFDNVSHEIAVTPLPGPVRRSGKLLLKGTIKPVGAAIGALLLFAAARWLDLRALALVTVGLSAVWALLAWRAGAGYRQALSEAVRTKRFGAAADDPTDEVAALAAEQVAAHALRADDPDAIQLGCELLAESGASALPKGALRHLEAPQPAVRAAVARLAGALGDRAATSALLRRLADERAPEVAWRVLEALARIDPAAARDAAVGLLARDEPLLRAGAIVVLLAEARQGDAEAARETLAELLAGVPAARQAAARAIGAIGASAALEEQLAQLISDPAEEVCIAAVRAAGEARAAGLAQQLAERLGDGRVGHHAGRALARLDDAALPALCAVARSVGPRDRIVAALRTIAALPGDAPEAALVTLAGETAAPPARLAIAREAAFRARRRGAGKGLRAAAHQHARAGAATLQLLDASAACGELPPLLRAEATARRRLTARAFLYWFAAATRPGPVLDAMPAIEQAERDASAAPRRGAAVELLDAVASDRTLRDAVTALERPPATRTGAALRAELAAAGDPWLLRALELSSQTGDEMNAAQKVLLLRKVSLFAQLPGEDLLAVAEATELRETAKGEKVFADGDAPDGIYVLASGAVRIAKGTKTLGVLQAGDFFGELGVLDNSLRLADAVAADDCVLLYIDKEVFDSLSEDVPSVLRAVVQTVVGYLRSQDESVREATMTHC